MPKTEQDLRALPGVGHYTANAILTFAHNEPRVFIETNIRRVFIHHFFSGRPTLSKIPKGGAGESLVSDKEILPLVEATLDTKDPCEWYYALMDYGAHLPKTARRNPNTQSKHYVRQSTFKGSLRELRGKIIRVLAEKPATFASLRRICDNNLRTKEALGALTKDKLIKKKEGMMKKSVIEGGLCFKGEEERFSFIPLGCSKNRGDLFPFILYELGIDPWSIEITNNFDLKLQVSDGRLKIDIRGKTGWMEIETLLYWLALKGYEGELVRTGEGEVPAVFSLQNKKVTMKITAEGFEPCELKLIPAHIELLRIS